MEIHWCLDNHLPQAFLKIPAELQLNSRKEHSLNANEINLIFIKQLEKKSGLGLILPNVL